MFKGAWKKYANYILIIVTGTLLLLFIFSNALSFGIRADEDEVTEYTASAEDEPSAAEEGGVDIVPEVTPEETPVETLEETEVEETPAEETPAEETPAGETQAGETEAGETEAGETPEGETPEGETPAEGTEGEEGENQCTCSVHCTEDSVNEECLVCSENYESCTAPQEEEVKCICTSKCTAAEFNEDCPVCSENFENCEFVEEEKEECTCEKKCEEGKVDLNCPVCAKDYLECKGDEEDYVACIHYTEAGESKQEKYLTLSEALNGAKAVADIVHSDGDSNYVPTVEMMDELSLSSSIVVETNSTFILDFKGYRIGLESGSSINLGNSNVTFKDSASSGINYGGDNTRPAGITGSSGTLLVGTGSVKFVNGYYGITSGTVCSGFNDITVEDAFLVNSAGCIVDTPSSVTINNGFFVYEAFFGGQSEGTLNLPSTKVLGDMTLSIGGYQIQGHGLSTALFRVTVQMVGDSDYYYSTFAEAFEAASGLSRTNDGALTIISINDPYVTNVAISQTYTLSGISEGYSPTVQINNITFTRGGAGFDGTMFAVSGGTLIFNDCSINGFIADNQVSVASMITVDSGACLSLTGTANVGTNLSGNVALLGATAGDPAAGVHLKNGGTLKVNGYVVIHNNISYSEVANADGVVEGTKINRNLFMDNNSQIVVEGALLRTEGFLVGVTMAADPVDLDDPIGSLSTDYYNGLVANGATEVNLSSFHMDTSAAYFMEFDFSTNTITWSKGGALLPEAGVFRLEYILLFIGFIGFIFRAISAKQDTRKEIVRYITVISVVCLVAGSGFGVYHAYKDIQLTRQNAQTMEAMINSIEEAEKAGANDELAAGHSENVITTVEDISMITTVEEVAPEKSLVPADGREYIGIIEIQPLNIKLPVLATYTDADMKTTPCVYYGTRDNGNLVIVGHNYDSQFGNFNQLNKDDTVTAKLTMVDGGVYTYTSKLIEDLEPDQIDEMLAGDWDLTLFTCSYSGEKRITIRFDLER